MATALTELSAEVETEILGEAVLKTITPRENIPNGHKISLCDIAAGEKIRKYGVVIGQATTDILKGSWVHLHVMKSLYDERSGHLDSVTGAPKDTRYE